jgi:hypothetical protein
MADALEESKVAEAANAAAVAKEADHNALKEMVSGVVACEIEKINQRIDAWEQYTKDRFEAGDRRMDTLTTKDDFRSLKALFIDPKTGESKLADKEDIARLNNIVHNFTLAAEILSTSGKWIYRAIIVIAVLVGAISLITGGFKAAGAGLVHWFAVSPSDALQ